MSPEALAVWQAFFTFYGIVGGAVAIGCAAVFAMSLCHPMYRVPPPPPPPPQWVPPSFPVKRRDTP
jgi:hypothetical protein